MERCQIYETSEETANPDCKIDTDVMLITKHCAILIRKIRKCTNYRKEEVERQIVLFSCGEDESIGMKFVVIDITFTDLRMGLRVVVLGHNNSERVV